MREIHGVSDAAQRAATSGQTQSVLVEDAGAEVRISLGGCSYPAGLTPAHARFIAKALLEAAKRAEATIARQKAAPK